MTRDQANTFLAVILEVVAASPGGAPSGPMYAALVGQDIGGYCVGLQDYQSLLAIAESTGLVTISRAHLVELTAKGRVILDKIAAFKAAQKRAAAAPSAGAQMPCGTYPTRDGGAQS